jgi:putative membrane fusion protein
MHKLKKDNLAILIVVLLVLIYVFYECYSVTHIQLETQTATLSTVYESVDATALIIRDEHTVSNSTSGVTVPCLNNGDKINVGGNVAMTFSSNDDASAYSKYSELESELEYYENLESQTVGQAASVESINNEIDDDIDSYIRAIASNDTTSVSSAGSTVNDSLLRRQMIIGENVDLVSIIQDLRKQVESYSSNTKPADYITTDESGVFTSVTDGYENLIDYSKIDSLSIDDVKAALDKVDTSVDTSSNVGKLVTSYDWYIATVVKADDVKNLKNGSKVNIALKDNGDTVLKVKIVSGAEPDAGEDETLLVMKCNTLTAELATMRKENIEIRYDSYDGIKVPASALHVVDGKKGVYVLISSQVKFRETDVIYSDDDYVLLSYDSDDSDGIHIYDKIILRGKDLQDGKVYT